MLLPEFAPKKLKRELRRCAVPISSSNFVVHGDASCQLAHTLSHRKQMRCEATTLAPDDSRQNETVSTVVTSNRT